MSKLLLLPGSFVADYCLPSTGDFGRSLTPYFVNDNFLSSFGIVLGMVVVTRKLRPDETPPDDSFCYVRVRGEPFFTRVRLESEDSVWLEDGTARKEFGKDEVEFEAVAVYACSCDLRGASCVAVPLSVEAGLPVLREDAGALRWQTDAEGNFIVGDELRQWLTMFGGDAGEWEGWGWTDFLHPEDRKTYLARWRESLSTGRLYLNRGRVYFAGAWLYMSVSGIPLHDDSGRRIGWKGFLHLEPVESRKSA